MMLELRGVGFDYPGTTVIDALDLSVDKHEIVMCVGPSGCGKSTLLGLLGGHLKPTRGTVTRTGVSRTIYQDGGLFPWQTVKQNIAAGLAPRIAPEQRTRKVDEWLEITRLGEFANHYPHQLSGGMRQRCEIARALAAETDILLMDEPFSALDYQTRNRMRNELVATLKERPRTVVFVTHDIEEAVQMGDRVVVLAARPTHVSQQLPLSLARPRKPGDAGVAAAEQAIMDALGMT